MPASRIPGVWVNALRIAVSLMLLAILLTLVDLGEMWSSLQKASASLIAGSFALFALQAVPESLRLKTTFTDWGVDLLAGFRLYLVGVFFNNFMPGVIGADVYQVQQLHAMRSGLLRPLSLLVLLRGSSLLINLSIVLLILAFDAGTAIETIETESIVRHFPDVSGSSAVFVVVMASLLILAVFSPWVRPALNRVGQFLAGTGGEVRAALATLSTGAVINIFVQGVFSVLLRAASLYVLILAFGGYANAVDVLLAVTVAIIVLALPITFAGIGVREAALSSILVASGTEAHVAVAAALVGRFFIWVLSLAGGLWFATHSK
jgi:uncharacterized membrane protein YbhN (UPF0104 family)